MRALIILCCVASTLALSWPRMWPESQETRPGDCQTIVDQRTLDEASRCQVDYDGRPLDYSCDAQGEETYKCCEYETGIRICVPPVIVPTNNQNDNNNDLLENQTLEEKVITAVNMARDYINKVNQYPPPERMTSIKPNTMRWCVSNSCELTKCQRMTSEFTYNSQMVPRKEWSCVKATSQQQCMFWIEQGWADIMSTRETDVFLANTTFHLKPVAYTTKITDDHPEIQSIKEYMNVTFALKLSRQSQPNTWAELQDKTTCHAGADFPASFHAVVLHLIQEGVLRPTGDVVESFADFIQESCVPGILNDTYNRNGTYPKNLVSLCEHNEEMYHGVEGSLKCLNSGKGQVTFVDHKMIEYIKTDNRMMNDFMVVCRDESKHLDDDIMEDTSCHIGHIARPTIFISNNNTVTKETEIRSLLKTAMNTFGLTNPLVDFNLFDTQSYECSPCPWTNQTYKENLIFLEEDNTLKLIDPSKVYAPHVFETFKMAEKLTPKTRAKMCVTTPKAHEACLRFKEVAEKITEVNDIAWGCVQATSAMECMKAVHNGTADLYQADPMETFIAGKEFMLEPIMSVHRNDSITNLPHDHTRTLAVIKASSLAQFEELMQAAEDQPKYIKDLWKLKVCSAGLTNVSAFHNPIGWLLANGTIPRVGSVFESLNRYFESTCVPGLEPDQFNWGSDLLLGHEVNWGHHTLNFYNFTGEDWLIWNTPATWDYLTYNRKVTKGSRIQNLAKLKKVMNMTSDLTLDSDFDFQVLDDLMGVEGLSTLAKGLLDTTDGQSKLGDVLFRERLSNAFPNFQGMRNTPFTNMQDMASKMADTRHIRVNNRREQMGINIPEEIQKEFTSKAQAYVFGHLMEMHTSKLHTLPDVIRRIQLIPVMTDFTQEEVGTALDHPAVRSYLRTYFPRLSEHFVEMFDNTEIREKELNRYTNPLWLSPRFPTFQQLTKTHLDSITKTCNSNLPLRFEGYEGSLRCLKSGVADVAFFDEQTLRDTAKLARVGFTYNDLRLLCPNGQVVEIDQDFEIAKVCNFGEVKNPAMLTAYNRSGSWRWNVTKAFMIAHKSPALFKMFGEGSLFGRDYDMLLPIDLLKQAYQPYLGPMVLRSFEAIIKPSSYDWFKDNRAICYGETYTNIIKHRNETCQAIVKDVKCVGEPPMKKVSVGQFGNKQYKMVKMCCRPSKFVRKMAPFTCDNGAGYLKNVLTAMACECEPCEEIIEYHSNFANDLQWQKDNNKYMLNHPQDPYDNVTVWGNSAFFYNHSLSPNFDLGDQAIIIEHIREIIRERPTIGIMRQMNVDMTPEDGMIMRDSLQNRIINRTCEEVWIGQNWHTEWFPLAHTTMGTCTAPTPGARMKSRNGRFRQTVRRLRNRQFDN